MNIGLVFPQTEIGADPAGIVALAKTAEALNYTHILAYDHVIGAEPAAARQYKASYTIDDSFHEPLTLFSFLAAITSSIELATGVLLAPLRSTGVLAKQAAEVAILSNGRLRLGVGVGSERARHEYHANGAEFGRRGARLDDQIVLLRELWTEYVVNRQDRSHDFRQQGINPRPGHSIPIWIGGRSDAALRRAALLGDGWIALEQPGPEFQTSREKLLTMRSAAGKDAEGFGIEGFVDFNSNRDRAVEELAEWEEAGATHVSVRTMRLGLNGAPRHIEAVEAYGEALAAIRK